MKPDDIVSPPREYETWLAPDWSDSSESTQKQKTWARVSVRETRYADGRVVTEVLDEKRQPIKTRVLDQIVDKKQEDRFRQAGDDAKPPGGLPNRTINGQVFQWNPSTRAYDIPAGSAEPAQPARTPAQTTIEQATAEQAIRDKAEKEANAALPKDQDPAYETNDDRRKRADVRIAQQGVDARAAEAATRAAAADTRAENADTRAENADTRAAAAANKPSVHLSQDGTTATIVAPDGTVRTVPTGVKGKPQTVTLEGRLYERDEATGTYVDKTPAKPQMPPNAPKFVVDWNPGTGMGTIPYAAEVRARTDLTDEQKTALITEARASAQAEAARVNALVSVQEGERSAGVTQRGQDMAQTNQRLVTGAGAAADATKSAGEMTKFSSGAGTAAAITGNSYRSSLMARAFGGMQDSPQVQSGPGIQQINAMPVTGGGMPGVIGAGPWAAPAAPATPEPPAAPAGLPAPIFRPQPPAQYPGTLPEPAFRPQPPAAYPGASADAAPVVAAPVAPARPPVAPARPAPVAPVTPAPVAPFTVGAPLPGVERGAAAPGPPTTAAPVMPAAPPVQVAPDSVQTIDTNMSGAYNPSLAVPPMPAAPHNPGPGEPGHDPNAPVGMRGVMGAGPWQQPQPQPYQPTGAGAVAMKASAGAYDPSPINRMLLEAGFDPDVVAAFGGVG